MASLYIPQDLGYAKLANLRENSLYNSFVSPLIYVFMGSSRDIAIGPVAVVSLLLGSLVQNEEVDYKTDTDDYLCLMLTATFFAGVTQLTLGFKSDLHFSSVKAVLSYQAKGI
ncbi:hypothetical protein ACFX13_038985 [Malus domestica]